MAKATPLDARHHLGHNDRTARASTSLLASSSSGVARRRKYRCNGAMSTKSRQTIYGGRIIGAEIRAQGARKAAQKAIREADRAEAEAWSIQMEGYGGPTHPSPTIALWVNGAACFGYEISGSEPWQETARLHATASAG